MILNVRLVMLLETLLLMELLADVTLDFIWQLRILVPLVLIFLPIAKHVLLLGVLFVKEILLLKKLDVLKYAVLSDALNVTTPRSATIVSLIWLHQLVKRHAFVRPDSSSKAVAVLLVHQDAPLAQVPALALHAQQVLNSWIKLVWHLRDWLSLLFWPLLP